MLRRYLFLGLTLMLTTVLVYLVVQSRRNEQSAAKARSTEIIVQSPTSVTRVIAPGDLIVESCRIRLTPFADSPGTANAGVDVEMRNSGSTAYRNLVLRIALLNGAGKTLQTQERLLRENVAPAATFSAALIPLDNVPRATTACNAEVLYADVKSDEENSATK